MADGVNVGYTVYLIETEITNNGAELKAREFVDKREKLSRRKRWEQLGPLQSTSVRDLFGCPFWHLDRFADVSKMI